MNFQEIVNFVFEWLRGPKPVTTEVNGQQYAIQKDGTLGEPVRELAPQFVKPTLEADTLSGLVAAYESGLDDFSKDSALHIGSPTSVSLISTRADKYGQRHIWARATHKQECPFKFGAYMDTETFLIAFRASFHFNENAVKIQQLLSSLTNESSVSVADDGISQVISAKVGAVTRTAVQLPPEIPLIFWRTFREANPVESKYMLRLKGESGKVPHAALFEIDAKWQIETMASIADYLRAALPEATIIA